MAVVPDLTARWPVVVLSNSCLLGAGANRRGGKVSADTEEDEVEVRDTARDEVIRGADRAEGRPRAGWRLVAGWWWCWRPRRPAIGGWW